MDFAQPEESDGIRLTWNIWPNSRLEATKCVIPFAALYTPSKRLPNMPVMPYEPVPCKQCGAILNPYASVDYNAKLWVCPFCYSRNHFPAHYQGISEQNVPAELYPQYTTMEYTLSRPGPPHPPVYLFVLDTCLAEDELQAAKGSVTQVLQMIPEYAHVGLITYGTHVHVHELGFTECSKAYVFRGSKEYTTQQVAEQLGLRGGAQRPGAAPGGPGAPPGGQPTRQFIMPASEADITITSVLDNLTKDAYPVVSSQRPARCTGTALQVAEALLGSYAQPGAGQSRIMLFVGGPCTEGAGKVIGRDLEEMIRSHKDLFKDAAPHFRKAKKFYDGLGAEAVQHGHIVDVFACALDNTGLYEMKDMVQLTGGMVVQIDSFKNVVFKESLKRLFAPEADEGFLGLSSNATLEVIPSRDIKVSGLLGPAARIEKKGPAVADTEIGQGGTTTWRMCGLQADSTLAVFFEVTGTDKANDGSAGQQLYIQFITRYQHWTGQSRCRVTTLTRFWTDGSNSADLIACFDQEAAAVVMARLATHKMETEDDFDATRFLDRALIRLCQRFAEYRKDDPMSFSLHPNMSFYPQFMFNLRRSPFVQVFGFGPDETANCRLCLFRVPVQDAMVMIQPQLTSYSMEGAEPALLDVCSIQPDRILLLDAYFYICVFFGETIGQWRRAKYHEQPEYASFAQLLAAPQDEAKDIGRKRFPVPRVVNCGPVEPFERSQSRFLLAKLNPSATYSNAQAAASSEVIMTDDVSLQVFTEHLKRLAVQS